MIENPSAPAPRKGSCLMKILIVLAGFCILSGCLWWWHNRPIHPVTLDSKEREVVERKIAVLQDGQAEQGNPPAQAAEPTYEKGAKEIVLTERELNGLLNANTDLGKSLQFELGTDAIHARFETDLPPDLPVVGGKRLKARARFLAHQDTEGAGIMLDDVTVWGVSLPNEWLGGLKGKNLLGEVLSSGRSNGLPGVKELEIEPGRLVIRLKD
jgi:hypothetical protein